jgi:hypothetical protein
MAMGFFNNNFPPGPPPMPVANQAGSDGPSLNK